MQENTDKQYLGKIISTISNKGGVGKTLFSIETATWLGKMGQKVLLIDTDLNTGDISIKLALNSSISLLDFFEKKESDLNNLIIKKYGIDIIPGAGGNFRFANINYAQKMKFIRAFKKISVNYDYTILDLGAGIERTTLDFALTADHSIIVTTSEDVQTGYGCAKAANERLAELEKRLADKHPNYAPRKTYSPLFVFNKTEPEIAKGMFIGIQRASQVTRNLGEVDLRPKMLGSIPADYKTVPKSYAQLHTPLNEKYPSSRIARSYELMAMTFVRNGNTAHKQKRLSPIDKIMNIFRMEKNSG